MEVYRRYWRIPGPSRPAILTWTRELPIAGEPADVDHIVNSYALAIEELEYKNLH